MEQARPLVFVLTDGSGSRGAARIASTSVLLEHTAARAGSIFGRLSDRAIYAAMLAHHTAFFIDLADELADELVAEGADCVVSDAIEGYNPSHDVCRLVTNAAIRLALQRRGVSIAAYDFPLDGAPDACPPDVRDEAILVRLDDEALKRKLAAARSYPELKSEVERALDRFGPTPFKTECLRPVKEADRYGWDPAQVPYYETYGEARVAAGAYDTVLRFSEHVRPVADALWSHSEPGS